MKFATALLCSSTGLDHVYFNSYETIELDSRHVLTIPEDLRCSVFLELIELKKRFFPLSHYGGETADNAPIGYHVKKYKDAIHHFYMAFNAFSIRNHLLMRTSNHLMKAIMLWDNKTFAEDAIMHSFIGLEGCLHLLQKKWGDASPKLNLVFLEKMFKDHIDETGSIFEFIKNGYKTRIALIHPEPVWGAEWNPFLLADDFYDYFKLARDLMFYYLTDVVRLNRVHY